MTFIVRLQPANPGILSDSPASKYSSAPPFSMMSSLHLPRTMTEAGARNQVRTFFFSSHSIISTSPTPSDLHTTTSSIRTSDPPHPTRRKILRLFLRHHKNINNSSLFGFGTRCIIHPWEESWRRVHITTHQQLLIRFDRTTNSAETIITLTTQSTNLRDTAPRLNERHPITTQSKRQKRE